MRVDLLRACMLNSQKLETYLPHTHSKRSTAPGLPKTFTSSHGHRHRHAPKPTQQPTVQNPAQQPTVQNTAPQPTVQNPAPQPTVQNTAPQPTVQNTAQQQPQTEQGHKRSREQGNQEFLKMLKENYGYPDTLL
ncbi:protein of unknown function, DUF4106 family [Trichomonas vaginalis G3]|uniref:protein of unknown function, DUF4106 family n=1 Tax=Trichomonas vaginalis (strain ATCC PRA-98 / G3) TaxID=412133 RepID=UPI0021E5DAD4|nr:protein of unknown function, DUF4106 family [Trichomonas vaginalis G3]KAI5542839.1 protein of unknown function, DUF4106 family [Trichomonas vaginalis G3]